MKAMDNERGGGRERHGVQQTMKGPNRADGTVGKGWNLDPMM